MAKAPQPTDLHVGNRVRMRRQALGISQEKIGAMVGVTFQQVQKYERGTNRISASRLHQMADILKVTPDYFFDGAGHKEIEFRDEVTELFTTSEGRDLMTAFSKLPTNKLRRRIVALVEELADSLEAPKEPV
jgi:transcriptional regulator with XRE-family HTH domain